jgi:hypothetical protein
MSRTPAFLACFALFVKLPSQVLSAQRNRSPRLNEDIALPIDFSLDYKLGLAGRVQIRGSSALLENTAYNEAGTEVFSKFVQNPSVSSLNSFLSLEFHDCRQRRSECIFPARWRGHGRFRAGQADRDEPRALGPRFCRMKRLTSREDKTVEKLGGHKIGHSAQSENTTEEIRRLLPS